MKLGGCLKKLGYDDLNIGFIRDTNQRYLQELKESEFNLRGKQV